MEAKITHRYAHQFQKIKLLRRSPSLWGGVVSDVLAKEEEEEIMDKKLVSWEISPDYRQKLSWTHPYFTYYYKRPSQPYTLRYTNLECYSSPEIFCDQRFSTPLYHGSYMQINSPSDVV